MLSSFSIDISAFRLQVGIHSMKLLDVFYPCAILPSTTRCTLEEVKGYVNVYRLSVIAVIEQLDSKLPDPGSRLGLIAEAFSMDISTGTDSTTVSHQKVNHVKMPKGPYGVDNSDELPEDLFHSKDASSSFLISQREQAQTKTRYPHTSIAKNDENCSDVEYIDVEAVRRSLVKDQASCLSDVSSFTSTASSFSETWGQLLE